MSFPRGLPNVRHATLHDDFLSGGEHGVCGDVTYFLIFPKISSEKENE
jgi:hypothetical protein